MAWASRMATQPAQPSPDPSWQMSQPSGAPGAQQQNSMAVHVKVVAVLEVIWGVLAAIAAVFVLFIFTVGSAVLKDAEGSGAPSWLAGAAAGLGLIIAAIVGALAVLALVGGTRLLKLRRSGKVFTYIVAALSLINFPVGTAFGVYAFIILSNQKTDQLLVNP